MFLLGFMAAISLVHLLNEDQGQTATSVSESELWIEEPFLIEDTTASIDGNHQDIIAKKNILIADLRKQVASLSNRQYQSTLMPVVQTETDPENKSLQTIEPQLTKMSMEDFERSMKDSFTDRFKGVVLELSGNELEAIKKSFDNSTDKNEWSYRYENSITSFLAEKDLNGDHFIQSISCNTQICRLEINTNNDENWDSVYASMTQQSWYKTITVEENSDYPGNHIYYLPSIDN